MGIPKKPTIADNHSRHHSEIHARLFQGTGLMRGGANVRIEWDGAQYVISALPSGAGGSAGGFQGEYDKTKSYSTGDTFVISTSTMIAGIVVAAGYYGVPAAGTDSAGNTWAGSVPANPTGNAVPQYPLPTIAAAPNDKYYAMPIMVYCGGVL
jgi:hypothetical protein